MLRTFSLALITLCLFTSLSAMAQQDAKMVAFNNMQHGKQDFVQGNYIKAYQELLPEAQHGNAQAQYAIGYLLYYGLGVPQNHEQSRYWTKKAATQGLPDAKRALAKMNEQTTQAPTTKPKASSKPKQKNVVTISSSLPSNLKQQAQTFKGLSNDHFVLQVMGTHNYPTLKKVSKELDLPESLIIRTYYQGKYWYIFVAGDYKTYQAALAAKKALNNDYPNIKAWPRKVLALKKKIQ